MSVRSEDHACSWHSQEESLSPLQDNRTRSGSPCISRNKLGRECLVPNFESCSSRVIPCL
eukprot:1274627-Lingulodinium_polyedra.AAC.1